MATHRVFLISVRAANYQQKSLIPYKYDRGTEANKDRYAANSIILSIPFVSLYSTFSHLTYIPLPLSLPSLSLVSLHGCLVLLVWDLAWDVWLISGI